MLKSFKSLIAGVVAGATLGVLFAPKTGKNTRNSIKKDIKSGGYGLNAVKETASSFGEDISSTAKDIYQDISQDENVKKGVSKAKNIASKAKKTAEDAYKKNVPAKKRKEIKKTIKKAKKQIEVGLDKAGDAISSVTERKDSKKK